MPETKPGRAIARPAQLSRPPAHDTPKKMFADLYPVLQKFLAHPRKSPNQHETGSLTIFVDDERYKVCLNDRPNEQSTFVSSDSLGDCFRIADSGLSSGTLKWRSKGYRATNQRPL